jgi:hypothetical protein
VFFGTDALLQVSLDSNEFGVFDGFLGTPHLGVFECLHG